MKKQMVTVGVMLLASVSFAAGVTYYVDAEHGKDTNDGMAEVQGEGDVGPKKTLVGVMSLITNIPTSESGRITVIALPGRYDEGIANEADRDTGTTLNRVSIPKYVTLKSRDGAESTFIVGEASTAPDRSVNGCGTNAVRCAIFTAASSRLEGFTLTGGRTSNAISTDNRSGGGCRGSGNVVDCVLSNNVASYRGGGAYYIGTAVRCRFLDGNVAELNTAATIDGSTCVNSYFKSGASFASRFYNCTFGQDAASRNAKCYNTIILGETSASGADQLYLTHCLLGRAPSTLAIVEDCVTNTVAEIAVDSMGRLGKGSTAIDGGSYVWFTNKIDAVWRDVDIDGRKRIANGALDYGCYEYDFLADYSEILSPLGAVSVTNATSNVVAGEGTVELTDACALEGTFNPFGDSACAISCFVEVEGEGTLSVYLDASGVAAATATAADGRKELRFDIAAKTGVRFAFSGSGKVALSDFTNASFAIIDVAQKGVALSGDITAAGTNFVSSGTATFTVSRADDSDVACLGIVANGEFFGFYDHPDGKTFTVSASDRASSLTIVAVYKDGPQDWFVDREHGSDGYSGLYTNRAFRTLAAAAHNAKFVSGETIWVLPGTYDEGSCTDDGYKTLARVYLKTGMTMKSVAGPERTIIVGAPTTNEAATSGIGPGAVRCASLAAKSRLEGFTLTGGYVHDSSKTSTSVYPECSGGGFLGANSDTALLVDCIVSNNTAVYGAAYSGHSIRCRYYRNNPAIGSDGFSAAKFTDCFFANQYSYNLYSGCYAYNCTFANGGGTGPRNGCLLYNCLLLNSSVPSDSNSKYYNCLYVKQPTGTSTTDGTCRLVEASEVAIDAETGRPLAGSLAIDEGSWENYLRAANDFATVDGVLAFDRAGGQRVYNGAIDVGCGEYDWRGDFAKTLAKRGVEVAEAGADVTTNLTAGLDVPAGESLKLKLVLRTDGRVSFNVVADDGAAVTVTAGGEPVAPDEFGKVEFEGVAGETEVEIDVTGEGKAVVSDVVLPKRGVLLIVR